MLISFYGIIMIVIFSFPKHHHQYKQCSEISIPSICLSVPLIASWCVICLRRYFYHHLDFWCFFFIITLTSDGFFLLSPWLLMVYLEDWPQCLNFPLALVLICLSLPGKPFYLWSKKSLMTKKTWPILMTTTNAHPTSSCPRAPQALAQSAPSPLVEVSCSDVAPGSKKVSIYIWCFTKVETLLIILTQHSQSAFNLLCLYIWIYKIPGKKHF